MWMAPTPHSKHHPTLHNPNHFQRQSPGLAQSGCNSSNGKGGGGAENLIEVYESFDQRGATQFGQFGSIFEQLHAITGSTAAASAGIEVSGRGKHALTSRPAVNTQRGDEQAEKEAMVTDNSIEGVIMEEVDGQEALDNAREDQGQQRDDGGHQYWSTAGSDARKPSSQLGTRAHSRSPAPSTNNLADNHNHDEARRVLEGAWRCLAEAPSLASPPLPSSPPLQPSPPGHPSFAPTALTPADTLPKSQAALSGSLHNNQHRSVGQYKRLISQSKRRLKSSISLDSLRSLPQNLYSLPSRRSDSTTTTSSSASNPPHSSSSASNSSATINARDQLPSSNPATRPTGIDRKNIRRRPSAQLLCSTSLLDRLRLEDSMMAHQHLQQSSQNMSCIEDMSHGQILSKYNNEVPYGAPLPLSPPPSATRPEFLSVNSYHVSEDSSGLSFSGSELGLARPQSMSSLRAPSSFSDSNSEESARRLSDPYQSLESVAESSMFLRQSQNNCWASPNWLADIPQSMELNMMESPASQSPTTQQWPDDQTGDRVPMQLTGVPVMMSNMNHPINSFRLASPPAGRGVQRLPSCPDFRGQSNGYNLQQPPSPAVEEHDMTNMEGYMERSRSNSSSIPSPPDSPDFYFQNSLHRTSSAGFPTTPLMCQDGFSSNIYGPMSVGIPRSSVVQPRPTRISSRNMPPTAAAAAAAVLAATKSSTKASKQRSSRRGVSVSNGRSQSSISSMGGVGRGGVGVSDGSEMAFVNFTPLDATKILSGVAPSGSSKTKARREREAQEKQRKLNEAAAAAVRAAGGDASQLQELLTV